MVETECVCSQNVYNLKVITLTKVSDSVCVRARARSYLSDLISYLALLEYEG